MALSVSFLVSQNILDPTNLVITDTSTGTDGAVVTRRIYLQTAMGTYLVPPTTTTDYILWPEPSAQISLNVLNMDYGISVLVQWLDVSNTVLYFSQQLDCFTLYTNQFLYYLTQLQAGGQRNLQDTNYFFNKMTLKVFEDAAKNATQYGTDIYGTQESLNSAAYMIDNQNSFF